MVPDLSGPGDRCSSEGWCRCWRRLQVQVELRSPAGAHLPRCGRVLTGRDQDRPTARGLGPDSGHSGPATGGHGWRGDTGKRQVQGSQGAGGAPGVSTPTTCRSRRVGRGAVGPGGGGGSAWAGAGRTGRPLRLALTSGKGRCVTPGPLSARSQPSNSAACRASAFSRAESKALRFRFGILTRKGGK